MWYRPPRWAPPAPTRRACPTGSPLPTSSRSPPAPSGRSAGCCAGPPRRASGCRRSASTSTCDSPRRRRAAASRPIWRTPCAPSRPSTTTNPQPTAGPTGSSSSAIPALRRDPSMSERNPQDRVIDLSVEVPGTPEEVWRAIATGPGITSWFVPHEVDEHEGGGVRTDFGAGFGEESARVAAWEPPHRLLLQGNGERALAYEWLVEAGAGGSCVVRLVNTGFGPGGGWDADYHGMSEGWPLFLENLCLHPRHFPRQRARGVTPPRMGPGTRDSAFGAVCAARGVPAALAAGDRPRASTAGAPPLAGRVASA